MVNQVVPQLIAKGKIPRPGIGVTLLSEESAAGLGIGGVVIDRVMPGSSADRAGLKGIDYHNRLLGDVILSVEGQEVRNVDDFVRMMQRFDIGRTVHLTVRRGDQVLDVNVQIMDIS